MNQIEQILSAQLLSPNLFDCTRIRSKRHLCTSLPSICDWWTSHPCARLLIWVFWTKDTNIPAMMLWLAWWKEGKIGESKKGQQGNGRPFLLIACSTLSRLQKRRDIDGRPWCNAKCFITMKKLCSRRNGEKNLAHALGCVIVFFALTGKSLTVECNVITKCIKIKSCN